MGDSRHPEPLRPAAPSRKGGQDLQYLRNSNLRALLSAIWDYGPISRFDLAGITGLAPSSITRLIQELTQLGLILETGKGESSGGRQPALISPNPDAGLVISLDLSAPQLRGGIFDAANHQIRVLNQDYRGFGPEIILGQILETINRLRDDPAARGRPLLGIGVSQPGTINYETGTIEDSFNLRLHKFPLRALLEQEFGLPVYIEHDASVAALAEQYYGAGRGCESLIYVLVSTGIGSGIITAGRIFRGETGKAGEFGHVIVEPGGPLCLCGQRGCLEALASAPALLASARWMVSHGRAPALDLACTGDPARLTIDLLAQAAVQDDPVARQILERGADHLALGITNFAALLDIRRVIIGGEVAESGELFFSRLHRTLRRTCRQGVEIEVVPAELRHDTFLKGISMLALQEALQLQVQRSA